MADAALPRVTVGIDQAWHDDMACGIDHLGIIGDDRMADSGDPAILDQHVARGKIADSRIHGQDPAVADQKSRHVGLFSQCTCAGTRRKFAICISASLASARCSVAQAT